MFRSCFGEQLQLGSTDVQGLTLEVFGMGAGSKSSQNSQSSISEFRVRMLQARPLSSKARFSWMSFPSGNSPCKLQFRSEISEQSSPLPFPVPVGAAPQAELWGLLVFHPGRGTLGHSEIISTTQSKQWPGNPSLRNLPCPLSAFLWSCFRIILFLSFFFSPVICGAE